jgi:two-component system LytT family sensor kinase
MRRLVSQAELRALQSQIHPHFLFNALNALYGVIPKEAGGARDTVLNLADLLRYFLQSERTFIPLEEELRIVRAYLEVESLRLGDRLRTSFDIDAAALQSPIPMLSLEPLVENAVRHGVARKASGGEVRVAAKIDGDAIRVSVSDTGMGFDNSKAPARPGNGVGLENVRRRLKLCYGEEARLDIETGGSGTVVQFRVPVAERVEVVS